MNPRTIVFFPEGAFGPTNNCIGIGDVLRRRGHRIVFVVEESFAGTLEAKGFEERLIRLAPPPDEPDEPGQFWKDFVRDTAPVFRTSTLDQLAGFIAPAWQALADGARYSHDRLSEIFAELAPDAIVEDNVVAFPAIPASGRPWVRIVSCNPLELEDPALPPRFSGLPVDDDTEWDAFRRGRPAAGGPNHAGAGRHSQRETPAAARDGHSCGSDRTRRVVINADWAASRCPRGGSRTSAPSAACVRGGRTRGRAPLERRTTQTQ